MEGFEELGIRPVFDQIAVIAMTSKAVPKCLSAPCRHSHSDKAIVAKRIQSVSMLPSIKMES